VDGLKMNFAKRRWRNITITITTAIALAVLYQAVDSALYQATFLTGWLLFVAILCLTLYRARKSVTMVPIGSAASWLQFHVYLGVLSVALFALHIGWRVPDGGIEISLAVLYILVAASGVIGLALSRMIPHRLTRRGEEVILERIPIFCAELRSDAEQLVLDSVEATKSSTIKEFYLANLHDFFARPRNLSHHLVASNRPLFTLLNEMDNLGRYLNAQEGKFHDRLRELVCKKDDLDFHYALQSTLKVWLFVHVPLTYSLLIVAIIHIVLVHAFGGGL